jgi:CBS domain-containing protein
MTIAAILRHKGHDVADVAPAVRIADLATQLTEKRIGAILVRDAAGQLLGIVSERDIVRGLARYGTDCLAMTAAQLMTSVLHTVTPTTSVAEAMALMTHSRVRHLPVLEDGKLVGLISIGDVVKTRIDQQAQEVDSLRAYVAGSV